MSRHATPFAVPRPTGPISLSEAMDMLPREDFRLRLRRHLQNHPTLTLAAVATHLGVTRQYVSALAGPLGRPNCARSDRPTPKRTEAAQRMVELELKVLNGQSAESAAWELGLSLNSAYQLGFRKRDIRPAHGSGKRDCRCWKCRKSTGQVQSRARMDPAKKVEILDWCAWRDPQDDLPLTQNRIGELTGVTQAMVSRIARAAQ